MGLIAGASESKLRTDEYMMARHVLESKSLQSHLYAGMLRSFVASRLRLVVTELRAETASAWISFLSVASML